MYKRKFFWFYSNKSKDNLPPPPPPSMEPLAEAKFLDEIQTKVFLLAIQSHLYSFALRFLFHQPHATSYSFYRADTLHYTVMMKKGGKSDHTPFCGLRNPFRNLKSENSQDYAQKPKNNCTFMNPVSGQKRHKVRHEGNTEEENNGYVVFK